MRGEGGSGGAASRDLYYLDTVGRRREHVCVWCDAARATLGCVSVCGPYR